MDGDPMNRTVIQQELFERLEAIERSLNKSSIRMAFHQDCLTVVWKGVGVERVRNS